MIIRPTLLLLGLIFLTSACATREVTTENVTGEIKAAKITGVSQLPPYTGYIKTWVVYEIEAHGVKTELFYPYFDRSRALPAINDECDFTFMVEKVSGQTGAKIVNSVVAKIIKDFNCR